MADAAGEVVEGQPVPAGAITDGVPASFLPPPYPSTDYGAAARAVRTPAHAEALLEHARARATVVETARGRPLERGVQGVPVRQCTGSNVVYRLGRTAVEGQVVPVRVAEVVPSHAYPHGADYTVTDANARYANDVRDGGDGREVSVTATMGASEEAANEQMRPRIRVDAAAASDSAA